MGGDDVDYLGRCCRATDIFAHHTPRLPIAPVVATGNTSCIPQRPSKQNELYVHTLHVHRAPWIVCDDVNIHGHWDNVKHRHHTVASPLHYTSTFFGDDDKHCLNIVTQPSPYDSMSIGDYVKNCTDLRAPGPRLAPRLSVTTLNFLVCRRPRYI